MPAGLLEDSTRHQPRARMVLSAALQARPSHAYLFQGPRGAGKRAAARAFAAEILAAGAEDPADTRRRAMQEPSPHPDLVWLAPSGAQHMVEEIRERVIRAASYRPFEGASRLFVIEAAEAMRDESQNALLKTLEEPPPFAHLLLISSEPPALLETVVSRCQTVEFTPLPLEAVEAELAGEGSAEEISAAARLSGGDMVLAHYLLDQAGRRLRRQAIDGDWRQILSTAQSAGEEAEAAVRERLEEEREAGVKRSARDIADEAKRAGRRRRTEVLDLGLALLAAWHRDLAAAAAGAPELVLNLDLREQLEAGARRLDAGRARGAVELVQDTRRRLELNVSEELALEALFVRLDRAVGGAAG